MNYAGDESASQTAASHHRGERSTWLQVLPDVPLAALLLPTLALGCLLGLFATLNELTDLTLLYQRPGAWIIGVTLTGLSTALIVGLARHVPHDRIARAIAAVICASVLLHVLYACSIDEPLRGDFEAMWLAAEEMVTRGLPADPTIYHWRALPLLAPVMFAFGAHPVIVPAMNIALLAAIQAIGCGLLLRSGQRRAALVFALIFGLVPETYHASITASHDIWGLFFLSIAIALALALQRAIVAVTVPARARWLRIGVLFVGSVLAIALLDLQRQIGLVVILGICVHLIRLVLTWMIATHRKQGRRKTCRQAAAASVLLAASVCGMGLTGWTLRTLGLLGDPDTVAMQQARVFASHGSSLASGYYSWLERFENDYMRKLEPTPAAWREFSRSLLLSDIANQPLSRVHAHLFRLYRQFDLGSNYRFYLMQTHTAQRDRYWAQRVWNVSFAAAFCLAVAFALVRTFGQERKSNAMLMQLSLLGALLLLLGAVGESQPRYIFPIWFIGAQLVATALYAQRTTRQITWVYRSLGVGATAATVVVSCAVGAWVVLDRSYDASDGRIIHGWRFSSAGGRDEVSERKALRRMQQHSGRDMRRSTTHNPDLQLLGNFGTHAAVLGFTEPMQVGTRVRAVSPRVCGAADEARALAFFVVATPEADERTFATLEVRFDGTKVFETNLPAKAAVEHYVALDAVPARACGAVQVDLVSGITTPSKRANRLTRVEVQFLRLLRTPRGAS
ncbi:hypothetical protein [Chiayiivirga flava]|uniref:Glycosyltransferase RgtA/B/C/D-like domain-containing protein n=1 Tax=Chiayiivirga flava TaxID=659595 RepID=A0A7W8D7T0_9GAMM|nr:hypothetical protein [Chiayiivirga flava]MBB5209172.1 hypothetical protein [Chiayiivirga flava]